MTSKNRAVLLAVSLLLGGQGLDSRAAEATPLLSDGDPRQAPAEINNVSGVVLETMVSGGYTYVRLELDDGEIWAASGVFKVDVGDTVVVASAIAMRDFQSPSLGRNFDLIYFAGEIVHGDASAEAVKLPADHVAVGQTAPTTARKETTPDFSDVKRTPDEYSIEAIREKKAELAGQQVAVRGKVVKFHAGILGANWLHIQDGTGSAQDGTNDLTITSQAVASVGQIISVVGTLELDKNFGAGYRYDAIVTDAQLKIQGE